MKNIARMSLVLLTLFIASSLTFPCVAEVYKYQDEHGRWHFTDKPPMGKETTEVAAEEKEETAALTKDLAAKLHEKYQPRTPIEQASLAVVAIHSPPALGSGFFISDDGYILTNKHVVNPTETIQWQELQGKVTETDEVYRQANKEFRSERARLDKAKKTLKGYKEEIDRADNSYAKRMAEEKYNLLKRRYMEYEKEYTQVKKDYISSKKGYEKARREFNIQSSYAVLRKNFKVILKDDTEVTARLIATSDDNDLALLKIDRYHTPFILPSDPELLRQGIRVFAIGNPLGIKDIMTAGVVAGLKDEYVVTDATVLPGSSGGPLVTGDGKVVGITSLKVYEVVGGEAVGGEGFGVAIVIQSAFTDFSEYIKK